MNVTHHGLTPLPTQTSNRVCPQCGALGRSVKPVTLQSLLKPDASAQIGPASYRFCPSENCDVVYFAETGGQQFNKSDLTVRVGIKETAAPRHVCYCFNHTIEEFRREHGLLGAESFDAWANSLFDSDASLKQFFAEEVLVRALGRRHRAMAETLLANARISICPRDSR